jgi:phosphonate degradation associated HDIG domain protein
VDRSEAVLIVEELFSLYERYGKSDYIGESVSQIEHMSQAAQLAESEGCDDEVVLAAFFHDIGHLCEFIMPASHMDEGIGIVDHELLGQEFLLKCGFSERIASMVRNHVQAKRYLTYKYPGYYDMLSDASKRTLHLQGGIMQADEAMNFESEPFFNDHLSLRKWDDRAKVQGKPLPDLEHFRQLAISHLMNK